MINEIKENLLAEDLLQERKLGIIEPEDFEGSEV